MPLFTRVTLPCSSNSSSSDGIPGFVCHSVVTDRTGPIRLHLSMSVWLLATLCPPCDLRARAYLIIAAKLDSGKALLTRSSFLIYRIPRLCERVTRCANGYTKRKALARRRIPDVHAIAGP